MAWDFVNMNGPYGGVTEGPAWDGNGLLYTHIPTSRILRYDPATHTSTEFRSETNNANGLMLDPSGRLYACEGGARRVVRYEADGGVTVLTDGFEGKRFNTWRSTRRVGCGSPTHTTRAPAVPGARTGPTRTSTTTPCTGSTLSRTVPGPQRA